MASNPNFFVNAGPASPAAYTNSVSVVVSQWDLTLLFFHSTPAPQGGVPESEPALEQRLVQGVVMSPQHAKALALVLDKNVKAWEDQNTPIELPEEILKQLAGDGSGASQGGS